MTAPEGLDGPSTVFLSGDDAEAERTTGRLLTDLGRPPSSQLHIGGITTARGQEHFALLFMGIAGGLGAHTFNINVVTRPSAQDLSAVRSRSTDHDGAIRRHELPGGGEDFVRSLPPRAPTVRQRPDVRTMLSGTFRKLRAGRPRVCFPWDGDGREAGDRPHRGPAGVRPGRPASHPEADQRRSTFGGAVGDQPERPARARASSSTRTRCRVRFLRRGGGRPPPSATPG